MNVRVSMWLCCYRVLLIGAITNLMKNGVFWDVTPCGSFLQESHGVTSQKMPFFIATALKNLKSYTNLVVLIS
jgi:hypothetical protein